VTTGAYLLLSIGAILSLGGWVMLTVLGFKKSIGWGLAILFLSWLIIPLVIFLTKYWAEAKTGFLLLVVGTVVSGIGWFAVVGSVATSAMAEFETFELTPTEVPVEEPIAAPAEDEPPPTVIEGEPATAVAEEAATDVPLEVSSPTPVVALPTPAGAVLGERVEWEQLIDPAHLSAHVGELVELRMRDGSVLRVTLDGVEPDALRVTQRVGGGALSYPVRRSQIAEIHVAR
jgi:hypothetical protein